MLCCAVYLPLHRLALAISLWIEHEIDSSRSCGHSLESRTAVFVGDRGLAGLGSDELSVFLLQGMADRGITRSSVEYG